MSDGAAAAAASETNAQIAQQRGSFQTDHGTPEAFVRRFFEEKTGHALVAWIQYFDKNHDRKVTLEEFVEGMTEMGYEGDSQKLYYLLDEDGSGFLTISEISPQSSDLWASFQHWVGKTFFSEEDLVEKLSGRKFAEKKKTIKVVEDKGVTKQQFYTQATSLGWYGGYEQIIFMALDVERKGIIYTTDFPWFMDERNRQIKKAKYKKIGNKGMEIMRKRLLALRSLTAFKSWLKFHYGPRLFHPWRRGIDRDGSMSVSRLELSTYCKNAGWRGDTNALWHALDSDESGVTSLDEFAGTEARALALFKHWAMKSFGTLRKTFKALFQKVHPGTRNSQLEVLRQSKMQQLQQLDKHDFCYAVGALGYLHDAGEVFDILDWEADGDRCVTYKELRCLENWEPVEWLYAMPNDESAEKFKIMLRARHKHPLKAWRALDEESCGKVSFKEFSVCGMRLGFRADTGHDVPGAWMALDRDASGYIALSEINPECAAALAEFRRWANLFFGSVMSAFMVLDADQGGSLSRAEFKKSVTKYGFHGDREELFSLLDTGGDGDINVEEMSFLDEWEYTEVCNDQIPTFVEVEAMLKKHGGGEDTDEEEEVSDDDFFNAQRRGAPSKREALYLQDHHLPEHDSILKAHKPMPGHDLVDLLGGLDPRSRGLNTPPISPTRSHKATSPLSRRPLTAEFSTSVVLPNMLSGTLSTSLGGTQLCTRSTSSSPRKNRSLRQVPYIGGSPLRKRSARASRSGPSPRNASGPSNFPLPLFI